MTQPPYVQPSQEAFFVVLTTKEQGNPSNDACRYIYTFSSLATHPYLVYRAVFQRQPMSARPWFLIGKDAVSLSLEYLSVFTKTSKKPQDIQTFF
ncbi:hypothetical protein BYT27DRAFT_7193681 [Phlegmacium glaucopus]|nr:hypothetical protein BYT27DRAFT_7193681 [Phlegmacium glaucopus]